MSFITKSIVRGTQIGLGVGGGIALLWSGAVLLAALGHWQQDDYFLVVFSLLFFGVGGAVIGAIGGLMLGILLPHWEAQDRLHDMLAWSGLALAGILLLCCILPTVAAVMDSCRSVAVGLTCDRP